MHIFLSLALALAVAAAGVPVAEASHDRAPKLSSAARSEIKKLGRMRDLKFFPVPILFGVSPSQVVDSWGELRSGGRSHEGTDIFARKGAYLVSPSRAVVTSIGEGELGGKFVYTTNPGGERFYFAHLDGYAPKLKVGQILEKGDLIGYVGNTGNAITTPPHLHLGIYDRRAENPFPRLTQEFTEEERLSAALRIVKSAKDPAAEARVLVGDQPSLFRAALARGEELPDELRVALAQAGSGVQAVVAAPEVPAPAPQAQVPAVVQAGLELGDEGPAVAALQKALIARNKGPAAAALAKAGTTGYFGPATQRALAEWQEAAGIEPATGYFGPLSLARMQDLGVL